MGPKGNTEGRTGPAPTGDEGDGDCVDFVLTLGGDGLLMYSNTLFRVSKRLRAIFWHCSRRGAARVGKCLGMVVPVHVGAANVVCC